LIELRTLSEEMNGVFLQCERFAEYWRPSASRWNGIVITRKCVSESIEQEFVFERMLMRYVME
jgi:hypothetical protein